MEIWKDIQGYEGYYQVSNEGRVKSLARVIVYKDGRTHTFKEKILRPRPHGYNKEYYTVFLCKDTVKCPMYIHKLVAEAFVSNPSGYSEIHHINHNSTDNRAENLKWLSENEHKRIHGKRKVYQYTLDGELVKVWDSTHEPQKQGNFLQVHINDCCLGKAKSHKGFKWSYERLQNNSEDKRS